MSQNDEPESVLDQILSACMQITAADSGSIMLLDQDKQTLRIRVARGLSVDTETFSLAVGQGVSGWAALHGKSRLVHDAQLEPDYVAVNDELRSELVAPMLVRADVIGVVSVDSRRANAFNVQQEHILSIMANLAAQIFQKLSDNRLLKIRDRFHRVMIEISRVVSASLRLEDVFREIMTITEKAFRLHRSTLLLYDREEDVLKIEASVNAPRDETAALRYAPGEGITGQVFLNKKAAYVPSVLQAPDFLNRMKLVGDSEDMAFFCCPIFSGPDVVGVFSTFTRQARDDEANSMLEFLEIVGSFISQAITIQKLVRDETRVVMFENIQLKRELSGKYQFGSLIGRSPAMMRLFEKVRIIADSRASILLTGESGTGKELIASAIHYNSPRRDGPFVKINCAAIPENLLESELFGHRKGAFTGAVADKKGKFEAADGGSIFLDEIGELDLNLQSKLLRVLQEREIEPVGGRTRQVDIRVIAATNADLEEKIAQKRFRADLYYRLNVIHLKIPPLRERKEDILALVHHFIEKFNKENGKNIAGIAPDAIQLLENYDWPGNVRQLENVLERSVVLSQRDALTAEDFQDSTLPFREFQNYTAEAEVGHAAPQTVELAVGGGDWAERTLPSEERLREMEGRVYDIVIAEVEKRLILMALKKFRYTKTQAARYLGINRNTLDKKIRELSIDY
ncbi:MAG: sigma 54-interacting transcriptional regulator [Leptospirales bacterium]|nr:sigma 54-interacting transcriptional regulator [Leptospirales bacterium]